MAPLLGREVPPRVPREERVQSLGAPIQQNVDVVVTGGPGILQQGRRVLLVERAAGVTKAVQRGPEGLSPVLVPAWAP